MKKLNNKGYLIVEIIVASALAMAIGYFLVRLTIKFSKQEEDIYYSLYNTNQKSVITGTIMKDLEMRSINNVSVVENKVEISFNDVIEDSVIDVDKDNNKITYKDYVWNFDNNIEIKDVNAPICDVDDNYCFIEIPIEDIYSSNIYNIRLIYKLEMAP